MIVKKNTFVQFNGFNELLYPNEENQFIKRVKKSEGKVYYHPEIKVFRSQRPDIKSYIKQMYTYGLGRGEQIKLEKKIESSFLIPLLFSLWVMVGVIPTLFFSIFDMLQTSISNIFIDSFILLNQSLMAVYNFLLLISWLNALSFSKHFSILFPFLSFICHFFMG